MLPPTPPNRGYQPLVEDNNPFRNHQHQPSGIPIKCNSPILRHIQHHPNPSPAQFPIYSYNSPQPTQIPQLQKRPEPIYQHQQLNIHHYGSSQENFGSNIPVYQYKQLNNGSPRIDNRSPVPHAPGSPYLKDFERLRANLEKPNFYEKNQKIPLESTTFGIDVTGTSNGTAEKTKDEGRNFLLTLCNYDNRKSSSKVLASMKINRFFLNRG